MRFADRLKELRVAAGLSQPQLAEASGLPVGSIRQYEQGRREPYWQVVFKLADALGVSSEAFKVCIDAGQSKARTTASKQRGKRK
jgi:transcriptional regulator with XRE-family HTH domain